MSNHSQGEKTSQRTHDGLELDTPYFRRSLAQQQDRNLELIELRIDHFLHEIGVMRVQIDQHHDLQAVTKDLNLLYLNKRNSVSELPEESRKSSVSSFNLDCNSLFLRRKASVHQPALSTIREHVNNFSPR